jgi:hypothetical protein
MLRLILLWLNLKKMDIEYLIAVFERKLMLQRLQRRFHQKLQQFGEEFPSSGGKAV